MIMKTVFKTMVGFLTALIIMVCFIFGCKWLSIDYNDLKFLAGWISCMGYNIATKLYDEVHS
jgi:hypothetical protein